MKVLGITGGVGSGKSEVLRFLEREYKAHVCQLDEVAKQLQKRGGICYAGIVAAFGEGILAGDGELDRQKLAAVIYGDEAKRLILNEIVHPEVKRWVERDIAEKKRHGVPFYVVEAALLPEAGYGRLCQEMWYVYAEEQTRRDRLKKSRGYSDEKISRMIASQSTEHVYRSACQAVIDNSGTFEETKRQIGLLCAPKGNGQ